VRFFAFTPVFAEISVRQKHKYEFFSKISNAKVCFCHSHSISHSRDVFTGFPARSVQELWLIKGLSATIVAGTGIKGMCLAFFRALVAIEEVS